MRTVRVIKPSNAENRGIACQDCDLPMPVNRDNQLLEIDWDLITLPLGWTERSIRATTALKGAVKRVESRAYFCPSCWVKHDASSLVPIPDPSLDKLEKALNNYVATSPAKTKSVSVTVDDGTEADMAPESSTKPSII